MKVLTQISSGKFEFMSGKSQGNVREFCSVPSMGTLLKNITQTANTSPFYTPGIYAEGYIVFVFLFVSLFVRLFIRSYFRPVHGITSKFYMQATRVEYISPTTHQKAFIFGP